MVDVHVGWHRPVHQQLYPLCLEDSRVSVISIATAEGVEFCVALKKNCGICTYSQPWICILNEFNSLKITIDGSECEIINQPTFKIHFIGNPLKLAIWLSSYLFVDEQIDKL